MKKSAVCCGAALIVIVLDKYEVAERQPPNVKRQVITSLILSNELLYARLIPLCITIPFTIQV